MEIQIINLDKYKTLYEKFEEDNAISILRAKPLGTDSNYIEIEYLDGEETKNSLTYVSSDKGDEVDRIKII